MPPKSESSMITASSEFDEDFPIQFDEEQGERFYLPLAGRLIDWSGGLPEFIGIAGPPGCGKTTFTRLLAHSIDQIFGIEKAVVPIGMDGWHFPNIYLENHFTVIDGIRVPLKNIKGAPQTFDLQSFIAFILAVHRGEARSYPIYSRKRHDPLPEAGTISTNTPFFLFEGNYLHIDLPGWKDISGLFNIRIFIDAPTPVLRSALRKRHLRGGKDPAKIEAFIDEVDLKNAALVREKRLPVHVEIVKLDEIRIGEIRYLEDPSPSSPPTILKSS